MDYDRIDVLEAGWGTIWQGGAVDAAIDAAPFEGPLLVVCMDRGESNEQFIDHATVEAVLAVWIDDSPDGCLKDNVLQDLAATCMVWLSHGASLYVHCAAGVSRASYMDVAIHCTALNVPASKALAMIQTERPVADPNTGFMAQLQRLWPGS